MRTFLKNLLKEAGQLALEGQENLHQDEYMKKNASGKDIVTKVDQAVEAFLIGKINESFPDHSIFGEETGLSEKKGARFRWVIDPIDGTNSFAHNQLCYCVSIAIQENGETLFGGIYAPRLNELFFAEKGHGATLNGKKIHVSTRKLLIETIVGTGFACVRAGLKHNTLPVLCAMLPQVRDMRRMGSAALDLCYTACGRFDGFYEFGLNLYDIAAGELIVREAGGTVTDFDGKTDYPKNGIIASNGILHSTYRSIINQNF